MGAAFLKPEDIANRALQRIGSLRIATLQDVSKNATEINFAYDKLRAAELRRTVWRFATRRAVLRAHTATTKRFIAPAWATSTVYAAGAVVQDTNGVYWVCAVANTAAGTGLGASGYNGPGSVQTGQPQYWQQYFGPVVGDTYSTATSYYAGEIVYVAGSPDAWYISLQNANLNQAVSSTSYWTEIASTGTTDEPIYLLSPVGPGVTIGTRARNVFWLPSAFLRMAPQDPRVENTVNLTTSAGLRYLDFEFENGYIVSAQAGPIIFRFCGDIQDVTAMDPLFCEALSARVALEMCEPFTQSNVKFQAIGQAYQGFMSLARAVNKIETANTEPEEEAFAVSSGPANVQESGAGEGQGQGG